jgi:hypothetical protein
VCTCELVDLCAVFHDSVSKVVRDDALDRAHVSQNTAEELLVELEFVDLAQVGPLVCFPLLLRYGVSIHDDCDRHVEDDKDHDEDKGVIEYGGGNAVYFSNIIVRERAKHNLDGADKPSVESREIPHLGTKHEVGHDFKGYDHQNQDDSELDDIFPAAAKRVGQLGYVGIDLSCFGFRV